MFHHKINQKRSPENSPPRELKLEAAMFDANQVLFHHACDTMPDSLSRRRLVLQALKVKTNPRHRAYTRICAQLAALESIAGLHSQLRAALPRPSKFNAARTDIAP